MYETSNHPLARYRAAHKLSREAFARMVQTNRQQIHKWEHGAVPRPKFMALIRDVTGGAVTANDWMPASTEEAAA